MRIMCAAFLCLLRTRRLLLDAVIALAWHDVFMVSERKATTSVTEQGLWERSPIMGRCSFTEGLVSDRVFKATVVVGRADAIMHIAAVA